MPEPVDDRKRQVVPRWWPVRVAASLGQLDAAVAARVPGPLVPMPGEVDEVTNNWSREQNPFHAGNLIDTALTLGKPELATDAAEWILANGGVSETSQLLARRILRQADGVIESDFGGGAPSDRHRKIAGFRNRLRAEPRNPLLWVELAREYSALGQNTAARRALLIALGLAPDSRHVLRSASRFFLHAHEPDMAHEILLASQATQSDPWLISAEIVAADARGRGSRLVKNGLRLVESGRAHPRHISELAGAIGTLEHSAGNRKRVRKLFAQALLAPTENTVAQAGWIGRHMPSFEMPVAFLDVPRAFEAQAWGSVQRGEFSAALASSHEWGLDEPFATRPVLFGSWVAAVALGDYAKAGDLVQSALTANPHDPRLVAQLLYCRASVGDIETAERLFLELERLTEVGEPHRTQIEWDVVLEADRGLLAYRRGQFDAGRTHYANAIEMAARHELKETAALALVNMAREEAQATGAQFDADLLQAAVAAFPEPTRGVVAAFAGRIQNGRL